MRILVTGGAGFLGSFLVERLLDEGHDVAVLDDLSTGSLDHLAACASSIDTTIGCVTDAALVAALARGTDRILHLASTVGVERVAADPERTRAVVESGTAAVLAAARRHGAPAIVVSSSEVYGFAPPVPVREDDLPAAIEGRAPRLAYARSKLAADRAALAAAADGMPVLVVRPFNLVGPRQSLDGGAVLPRFVASALQGEPLLVHGDGGQRRTFLDVRDAASLIAALARRESFPIAAVNLGGVYEVSILELARTVASRLASRSSVAIVPPPLARGGIEIARRVPDLARLRALCSASRTEGGGFDLDRLRPIADSIDALALETAPRCAESPAASC